MKPEEDAGVHVGFDVGATNMRVARVSAEGLGQTRKVATPRDAHEGASLLTKLIRECTGDARLSGVAGGVAAIITKETIFRVPNLEGWTNFDLREALAEELGVYVQLHNDADLAALGESVYGAGAGKRLVAYVGVGTGVGTARIVDGRIDSGVFDFEAGHQILDVTGTKTLEELVSGGAFTDRFGVHPKDVPREEYERMTPVLAAGIYNIVLHWSPEVVVLGGSMMNEENGYRRDDVVAALESLTSIYPAWPEVRLSQRKDDAGLHGARALLCGGHSSRDA